MDSNRYEYLAKNIFEACLEVHRTMGPGLMESIYESCILKELEFRKINARSQVSIPVSYKGHQLNKDYRIDILVEDEIIIELKTCEALLPVHSAQIISYLKLADKRMGFLVNFNVRLIKNGFKRFVNDYKHIYEEDEE